MPIAAPINAAVSTTPVTRNIVQTTWPVISSKRWANMYDANPNLREIQAGNVPFASPGKTLVSDKSALDKNRNVYERDDKTGQMRLVSQAGVPVATGAKDVRFDFSKENVEKATSGLTPEERTALMNKIKAAGPDVDARRRAFAEGINKVAPVITATTENKSNVPDTPKQTLNQFLNGEGLWAFGQYDSDILDATQEEINRNKAEAAKGVASQWISNSQEAEANLQRFNQQERDAIWARMKDFASQQEARDVQAGVAIMQRQARAENAKRLRLLGQIRGQLAARWVDVSNLTPEEIIGLSGEAWAQLLASVEEDKTNAENQIEARKDNLLANLQGLREKGEISQSQLDRESAKVNADAKAQQLNISQNYLNTLFSTATENINQNKQQSADVLNTLQTVAGTLGLTGQKLAAAVQMVGQTGVDDPSKAASILMSLGSTPGNPVFDLVAEARQEASDAAASQRAFEASKVIDPKLIGSATSLATNQATNQNRIDIQNIKANIELQKIAAAAQRAVLTARSKAAKWWKSSPSDKPLSVAESERAAALVSALWKTNVPVSMPRTQNEYKAIVWIPWAWAILAEQKLGKSQDMISGIE